VRSFERFYRAEHGRVLALVYAMTGSWPVAEDLCQEAFARGYERWSRVQHHQRPGAWVAKVAVNLARSRGRRRGAERRALKKVLPDETLVEPDPLPDDVARFWAAVRRLPRQQALAVAMNYLEDAQPSEMAPVLGCSPATARVHLHRARTRLQRDLDVAELEEHS
jgi:RNA polymerase sigma factor (sigma-70 family)